MMKPSLAAFVMTVGMSCTVAAVGGDPAEARYRAGQELAAQGRAAEARTKLEEALALSPDGPFAADVLLALAELDVPGIGLDRWGEAAPGSIVRAQARLERLIAAFPNSENTPLAAYRLGLLLMHPLNPKESLDGAYRIFLGVARDFPRRDEAAQALYGAGTCRLLQGARAASAAQDIHVVTIYGWSSVAGEGRLRLARSAAILGEPVLVSPLLDPLTMPGSAPGPARMAEAGRTVDTRTRARDLQALIVRAQGDRPDAPDARALDATYQSPPAAAEILALETSPRGSVWKLEEGSDLAVEVGGSGRSAPNTSGERTRGFALDGTGAIHVWDDKGIVLPTGRRFTPSVPDPGQGQPGGVRRLGGLAIGPRQDLIVLDAGANRILRYGMDLTFREVVASFESRPTAVRVGEDGTIYILLGALRQIVTVAPTGAKGVLDLASPAVQMSSPASLGLDPLGRLYVLDASAKSITILDPSGRRVGAVGQGKGRPGELRSPTAFAVDPAGRVYVADRKLGRIVRFK